MSKPNIVIVVPSLECGGIERVMINLATGFLQKKCTVHIVMFRNFIELPIPSQASIHYFKNHHRWLPRKIRGAIVSPILDKFISKNCGAVDLVLSNQFFSHAILCNSKLNVHFMIHGNFNAKTNNTSLNIYQKKPIICVSKGIMNAVIKIVKPQKIIKTIYNPVDTKLVEKIANDRSTLDVKEYIVCVGRLVSGKGCDILIKAYHKSGVKNSLVFVGQGPLEAELKELATSLNLESKIVFAGFYSNPYPLIKNAKLMVLSSDYEGLPMVILEALSLDVPVISTDCPHGPAEILPSKNLCSVGNINELSELIKKATNDPAQYQHPLDKKFTLNYAIEKYLQLID